MSEHAHSTGASFEFTLPDAGAGGELRTASALAAEREAVLAVLLRGHYCPRSRELVRTLRDGHEAFASRSTAVLPVLPERHGRAAVWHRRYELPFDLLADPSGPSDGGDERFGAFAPFERTASRLPVGVLFDADGDDLRFVRTVGGDEPGDEPTVERLLAAVDEHDAVGRTGPADPASSGSSTGSDSSASSAGPAGTGGSSGSTGSVDLAGDLETTGDD